MNLNKTNIKKSHSSTPEITGAAIRAACSSAFGQTINLIVSRAKLARNLTASLVCAVFLSVLAGQVSAQAQSISGYYEADDGGAFFIREVGNTIYWFGEHPNGSYANVLKGKIAGGKITASFWDVPKGRSRGAGEITLAVTNGGATITKISSTSPFGAKVFKKAVVESKTVNGVPVIKGFPVEMRSRAEGFSGGEANLTGAWTGDDAATYYVREMPDGDVVWVAENNFWGGNGGTAQPVFTHVFIGRKLGQSIIGDWADVPKGEAKGNGVLGLSIKGAQDLSVNTAPAGIEAGVLWRSLPNRLRGFADLHSHPMVNLALGGKFVHGGNDVGSLLPADADCKKNVRAKSIGHALGSDNATHGGWGLDNQCGDDLREALVDSFQEQNNALVTAENAVGYPNFKDYPKWNDVTSQKMWVDWVRRSYDGGQRILVALAMNNRTLASGVSGPGDGPTDDKASADLQLREMKSFVGRHNDFMEIAYTPADLRRIVASNRMAIILGLEIDDIGNFDKGTISGPIIYSEINRLYHEMGVRYVFPIHLTDNKFGGTAIYQNIFNLSNYHQTDKFWNVVCSEKIESITHRFDKEGFQASLDAMKFVKLGLDVARTPPDSPACAGLGHKNGTGLTAEYGGRVIDELMNRGMLIDVDHMSLAAFDATVKKAKEVNGGYPLVSGHTGFRDVQHTENSRTDAQLKTIADLGGMFGLGSSHVKAGEYLDYYLRANKIMGAGRVALGSDLNGLEKGPPPAGKACAKTIYNAAYIQSETGTKTWDYCTEGVAHYGMLPDFLRDLTAKPRGGELNAGMMQNAETFARMWEKAAKNGKPGNK